MSAEEPDLGRLLISAAKSNALTACETCGRTSGVVRMEELRSDLLPYKTCSDCGLVLYHHRDANKKELTNCGKWTVLAELTKEKKWEDALHRLALYPKEAQRESGRYDDQGEEDGYMGDGKFECPSALYHAINLQAPVELVQKLALAAPSEICNVFYDYLEVYQCDSFYGGTMGYDVSMGYGGFYGGRGDLEERIIDKTMSPLQLAVSKANQSDYWVDAVIAMLAIYLERMGGHGFPNKIVVALKLAWQNIEDFVYSALGSDVPSGSDIFQVLNDGLGDEWKRGWEVLTLLYRAAHFRCLEKGQSVLRAIACIDIECPEALLLFAIRMYPEELEKHGGSILHSMVAHSRRPTMSHSGTDKHPLSSRIFNSEYGAGDESDDDYEDPCFKIQHVEMLVDAYPRSAAVYSQDGLLPLHLAIRSRRKWYDGVEALVTAFPDGLRRRDPNGLYPFMLAASSEVIDENDNEDPQVLSPCWGGPIHDFRLIYSLLCACPDVCALGDSEPSTFENNGGTKRKRDGVGEKDCIKPKKKSPGH